ncbi:Ankyrin-3 [Colletotrichum fructicola]|uniref:Ankyrin unc44 n=1 Tax=Colletotrichum fructicola (strain Nara gc5) TaxID=1213859 RepID=L2FTI9_COLFN|nr:Ankyrin-3 [Colletotrichum fructicola]KAF5495554.1 Ankyrin-3 [Colletotrichum fructicola]
MDASPERDWAKVLEEVHAKTFSAYLSLRQRAVNDDSQPLRDVVTTLRLLVGATQSLALLVEELRMRELDFLFDGPKPGRNLLDTLDGTLSDLDQATQGENINEKILVNLRANFSGLRTAAATDHHLDFELCLSTIGSPSVVEQRPQPALSTLNDPHHHDNSYNDALACVEQICGPDVQLAKPGEYYVYKAKLAERDVERPSYGTYALRLPKLVEKHWGSIRRDESITPETAQYAFQSDFKHLFSPKLKSGNFENWVLEYARQQWPERFDPTSPNFSTKPLVRLMSQVSDPSLRPIHVAAALGMAEVCRWLISADPESVRMRSPWGTPFYCALLGPNAFLGRVADPVELLADMRTPINQNGTLVVLQNAGGALKGTDSSIIGPSQDEPVSLATLAFLVCNFLRSPEKFLNIMDHNPDVFFFDDRFLTLFRSSRSERSTLKNWPIPFPPICLNFLGSVLPVILDRAVINYDSYNDMSMLATGVYDMIGFCDLVPEYLQRASPLLDITPKAYTSLVREAVQDREVDVVRRLTEDPRWDPNAFLHKEIPSLHPTGDSSDVPDKGTSILHWAVESDDLALTHLILNSGSNVHVRNPRNQTPLLLSESPDVFNLLLSHGAQTTDTDEDGRNIWHVAAANSDIDLINCLLENDENQDQNLRARMRGGQTPIAQGIIYPFKQMIKGPKSSPKPPFGALHLLKWCKKDPVYLRSPKPLLFLAAEWGSEALASSLLEFGADPNAVDDHGRSVLHYLNASATPELVRTLKKGCKAPALDNRGLSPAETIFAAFNLEKGGRLSKKARNHPAYSEPLKASAYECLLTRDVLVSRNASGAGLWERFVTTVIAEWSPRWPEGLDTGPSILTALNALVKMWALADYETSTQSSALFPIVYTWIEGLPTHSEVPPWMGDVFGCILKASGFKDSLKASPEAITLLKACIQQGRGDLVPKLLKVGISVHERVDGTSALEVACQGEETSRCNLEMFENILSHAEVERLNEVEEGGTGLLEWLLEDLVSSRDKKLSCLLDYGCDPNAGVGVRGTPIVLNYISGNQIDGARTLLRHGADPSATDTSGRDSALTAVSVGSLRLVVCLKNFYYADIYWARTCTSQFEVKSVAGSKRTIISNTFNALHIASIGGHEAIVDFYIKELRLSTNVATLHERWTPLHCAALGGSTSCMRVLIEHGADPTREDYQGRTPLMIAVEAGDTEAVRLLLKPCSAKMAIEKPFLRALEIGYGVLLGLFAPYLTTLLPRLTQTPDEDQASRGHLAGAILEALITEGDKTAWKTCERVLEYLDPAALNDIRLSCGECSPVVFALRSGCYRTCLRLLQHGMRPEVMTKQCPRHLHAPPSSAHENFHPCTVLHLAVHRLSEKRSPKRHIHEIVQFLLLHTDWYQHPISPIHYAAICRNGAANAALLAILAHLKMYSSRYQDMVPEGQFRITDRTNPDRAWAHNQQKVLSHFFNQRISSDAFSPEFEKGDSPLLLAIRVKSSTSMQIIQILVTHGTDLSDGNATTPLHEAAGNNFVEAVEYLLQVGANCSLRDVDGFTPLMVAVAEGNLDTAKVLVSHGASIHVRDAHGTGLLGIGAKSKNPAVLQWLLVVGLDPYEPDQQNLTPLHCALCNVHLSSFVLNYGFDLSNIVRGGGKDFLAELFTQTRASESLAKLLKRLPTEERLALVNLSLEDPFTPLCRAIVEDNLYRARVLLEYGARLDEEGASEGSALMLACSYGRMEFVKMFVHLGASISHVAHAADGQRVFRNALALAEPFPGIVRWLLVERHTSQRRLRGVDAEAMDIDQAVKPWAGVCIAEYDVSETGMIVARAARESSLDYVKRLEGVRRGLRGTVLRDVQLEH